MVFNPVLQHFKSIEDKYGYKLHTETKTTSTITLPYADDFCLITTNLRSHQNIINSIQNHITSMGMKLKPVKCRSFSISGGVSKDIPFHIGNSRVPSIRDEEQNFLGCVISFSGKSEDTFQLLKTTLKKALDNVESL